MNKQIFALWENGTYTKPWKALELLNKAIGLDPNDAGVYSNRVISFVLMGLKDKGCSDLRKACEIGYCSGWQWAREKGY